MSESRSGSFDRIMRMLGRMLGRVALVLLGVFLVEVGLRAWTGIFLGAYDASAVKSAWMERAGRAAYPEREPLASSEPAFNRAVAAFTGGNYQPHPFVGFEASRDADEFIAQLATWQSDQALFDRMCTVLVLGGSVAEGFADPVNGGMAPLRKQLQADPRFAGQEILILPHARAAYKQPQQLQWLAWLLSLGFEPDILINLDGFNEVALAAINAEFDSYPLYPSLLHWHNSTEAGNGTTLEDARALDFVSRQLAARALEWELERSALASMFFNAALVHLDRKVNQLEELGVKTQSNASSSVFGPPFSASVDSAVELSVKAWAHSSTAMNDLCQARGIQYLHVLQPTLHDVGSKTLTEAEIGNSELPASAIRAVQLGYPLLRKAGAQLARSGVPFLDASQVFREDEETIYMDACHFVRPGTTILGQFVADFLQQTSGD